MTTTDNLLTRIIEDCPKNKSVATAFRTYQIGLAEFADRYSLESQTATQAQVQKAQDFAYSLVRKYFGSAEPLPV